MLSVIELKDEHFSLSSISEQHKCVKCPEMNSLNNCNFSIKFIPIRSSLIHQNAGVGDIISSVGRAKLGKLNV